MDHLAHCREAVLFCITAFNSAGIGRLSTVALVAEHDSLAAAMALVASVVAFAYESRQLINVEASIREDVEIEVVNGQKKAKRPLQREVMKTLAKTLDTHSRISRYECATPQQKKTLDTNGESLLVDRLTPFALDSFLVLSCEKYVVHPIGSGLFGVSHYAAEIFL